MKCDLVIVGAGPAGISAAIQAAGFGATVVIVDENPVPGGKLLGQLHEEPDIGWWIGKKNAEEMVTKAKKLGVIFLQEREVWGVYPHWTLKLNKGEEIKAPYVLLATGAAEKAIPIPGWNVPGVMAIGAAQVMNNFHRVSPGKKVAVVGNDPLALTVAHELKISGSKVVGIFLPPKNNYSNGKSNPKEMISYLSNMSDLAPNKLLKFAGEMAKGKAIQEIGAHFYPKNGIRVWGIPLLLRKSIIEIIGKSRVEGIKVVNIDVNGIPKPNSEELVEVDSVCISGGLYPLAELATTSGCQTSYIEELGGHVPLHSPEMETTQKGIFVAGNITGIEGAKIAMSQGELVGISISARLGLINGADTLIKKAQENVINARQNSLIKFQVNIEQGRKKMEELWSQNYNSAFDKVITKI